MKSSCCFLAVAYTLPPRIEPKASIPRQPQLFPISNTIIYPYHCNPQLKSKTHPTNTYTLKNLFPFPRNHHILHISLSPPLQRSRNPTCKKSKPSCPPIPRVVKLLDSNKFHNDERFLRKTNECAIRRVYYDSSLPLLYHPIWDISLPPNLTGSIDFNVEMDKWVDGIERM